MWPSDIVYLQTIFSIVFYVFGIGAAIVAFASLRANRQNQREANARRAYLDYARLGIEYPEFAFPRHLEINLEKQTIKESRLEFERYEWFISILLGTVRFFLESTSRKGMWRKMMILQLAYHWEYLDKYRNEKEYLKQWALELKSEFNEAIALGKRLYPPNRTT